MNATRRLLLLMLAALTWLPAANAADATVIVLATTTSLDNSGLLGAILPAFSRETGIMVRVLAQGTGQAQAGARLALSCHPERSEGSTAGYRVAARSVRSFACGSGRQA